MRGSQGDKRFHLLWRLTPSSTSGQSTTARTAERIGFGSVQVHEVVMRVRRDNAHNDVDHEKKVSEHAPQLESS